MVVSVVSVLDLERFLQSKVDVSVTTVTFIAGQPSPASQFLCCLPSSLLTPV